MQQQGRACSASADEKPPSAKRLMLHLVDALLQCLATEAEGCHLTKGVPLDDGFCACPDSWIASR